VDGSPIGEHDRFAVADLAVKGHPERLVVGEFKDLYVLALVGGAAPGIRASREGVGRSVEVQALVCA
jgi:hypothetical protein